MEKEEKNPLMHDFKEKTSEKLFSGKVIAILTVVLLLGAGSGYLFAQKVSGGASLVKNGSKSSISKGTIVGSNDLETFKDPAEGVLTEGGIEGEGQFHLVRPGGDTQSVYMTSSLVDLSKFVGVKVKVWGETQKAQKAGWLMDVGRVEVLE